MQWVLDKHLLRGLAALPALVLAASAAAAPEGQKPVPDQICLLCHADVRTPAVAAAELPDTVRALPVHSRVACVDCHAALQDFDLEELEHDTDLPPADCGHCHADVQKRMARSEHAAMGMDCASCHGSHDLRAVRDADAPVAAGRVNALCSRCHADIASPAQNGIHASALAGRTCVSCHDPHAAAPPAAAAADQNCLACHEGTEPSDPALAAPEAVADSVHGRAGISCVLCHADLLETEDYPHDSVGKVRCESCHAEASLAWQRGVHSSIVDGQPAAGCKDCHGGHDVQPAADARSRVYPLALPDTCESCHRPSPPAAHPAPAGEKVAVYETSVHGRALRQSGLIVTATCSSCHGSHEIRHVDDPAASTARGSVPYTCGACHAGILKDYLAGVHGEGFLSGGADVPVCTDCHGEHSIEDPSLARSSVSAAKVAETCARCHADDRLAETYGLPSTVLRSYARSYHGIASGYGETGAANCASCHGFHAIFPSSDERSKINPANLEATCGSCHPGAGEAFSRVPVHSLIDRETNFVPWVVRELYLLLITVIIGAFIVFILADLFGRLRLRLGWGPAEVEPVDPHDYPDEDALIGGEETFPRMGLQARLQHGLLVASFLLLVVTGLPLLLSPIPTLRDALGFEGGFRLRSVLHRAGAVGLIGLSVWHLAGGLILPGDRRWFRSIILRPRDVSDFLKEFMFNLGFTAWLARRRPFERFFERHPGLRFDKRPELGRYSLVEKTEYWAVVWGTAVMIATGFLLWHPDWFLDVLPTWAFDLARVVHGYEATLAFLAIIVWHMYHVHLRPGVFPMSRIWLTGRISREELRRHHPREYKRVLEKRRRKTD